MRGRIRYKYALSSRGIYFLFLLFIYYGPVPSVAQHLTADIDRVIRLDTELYASEVEFITIYLHYDTLSYTHAFHLGAAERRIANDSFIDAENCLSLFSIYSYFSLRKCLDSSPKALRILHKYENLLGISLEDLVFQQSKLPKSPRFISSVASPKLVDWNLSELISLAKSQERLSFCSVSELNNLLALQIMDQLRNALKICESLIEIDEQTFAEAKRGKLNFRQLTRLTEYFLNEIKSIENAPCRTNLYPYNMHRGFYARKIKGIDFYTMTGKTKEGNVFVGLSPSTNTAVVLLSEGRSAEIIDLGYLLMRMLNNNWKLK